MSTRRQQTVRVSTLHSKIMPVLVLSFLVQCGPGPTRIGSNQATDPVKEQIFKDVGEAIKRAHAEDIPLLSPTKFAVANRLYLAALEDYEKGERLSEIQERLNRAKQNLETAFEAAKLARVVLKELIKARKEIMELEIPKFVTSTFSRAEEYFKEAAMEIENDDLKSAKSIAEQSAGEYRNAVTEYLRKFVLENAKAKLNGAKKTILRDSYKKADDLLDATEEYIDAQEADSFEILELYNEIHNRIRQALAIAGIETDAPQIAVLVERALSGIKNYRLRMEGGMGYTSDGVVDVEKKAAHITVRLGLESPCQVEYYWIGDSAYGISQHSQIWHRIAVPGEPVSRLHNLFAILKAGKVTAVAKEDFQNERCWRLSVAPDLSSLHRNADAFADTQFSPLTRGSEKDKQLFVRLKEALKVVKAQITLWVSAETHHIRKAILSTQALGVESQMTYYITNVNDPNLKIIPPADALASKGPAVPFGALVMKIGKWGWSEYIHCKMTEKSIELIKNSDAAGKYAEICEGWGTPPLYYCERDAEADPKKKFQKSIVPGSYDHPCVQGAWAEDAGDVERIQFTNMDPSDIAVRTFRDHQHFGGEEDGLVYRDYFALRGKKKKIQVPVPPTGIYMSAKNWGYSGELNDRMNFQGAVDVYNHYTQNGTKEAYYRMGHVLHLLQDQAQPDHTNRRDHAASCMNEEQAYHELEICTARALHVFEIWTIGGGFIFDLIALFAAKTAYEICEANIDPNQVGFEYLIDRNWDKIQMTGLKIEKEDSYEEYFKSMALLSQLKGSTMRSPLGLGSALVSIIYSAGGGGKAKPYETVDGVDPDINSKDPKATLPYFELANAVIPPAVNKGAGLLEHFFEIVNHPPYVQEVVVYQSSDLLRIDEVIGRVFPKNPEVKPSIEIVYRGWWACIYDNPTHPYKDEKLLKRDFSWWQERFEPQKCTFVLVRVTSEMENFILTLKGESGLGIDHYALTKIEPDAPIYASNVPNSCDYPPTTYYGAIIDPNRIHNCGSITFAFAGEDLEAHYSNPSTGRVHSGKELDSNPTTIAVVDRDFPYNWIDNTSTNYIKMNPKVKPGYEPGIDTHHKIMIHPPDQYEPNNDWADATTIKVKPDMVNTYDNLSIHYPHDIDFYSLDVPFSNNPECRGGRSITPISTFSILKPSLLCISAKPKFWYDGLVVSFRDGSQHVFNQNINYPIVFMGFEDNFAGEGNVQFSVATKPDASGYEGTDCYSLTIDHSGCKSEPLDIASSEPPPEWIFELVEKLNTHPQALVDIIKPPAPVAPKRWFYPSNPSTIKLLMQGDTLGSIPPEYFIVKILDNIPLKVDIEMVSSIPTGDLNFVLYNPRGEVIAKAKEISTRVEHSEYFMIGQREKVHPRSEYSHRKQINVDNLKPGIFVLEVSGNKIPVDYSIRFNHQ